MIVLKHIKPLPGETRTKYFDSEYGGLCLRVGARDKAWCYYYYDWNNNPITNDYYLNYYSNSDTTYDGIHNNRYSAMNKTIIVLT